MSTFKGLQEQANHLCGWFRELGLERGDKIGFLMDNGLFTAQLFLGAMYGGLVSRCRSTRAPARLNCPTCWTTVTPRSLLWEVQYHDSLITEAMASVSRRVDVIHADLDDYLEVSKSSSIIGTLTSLTAEDPCLLMYSSGTTGRPKGAVHTHKSILAHGRNSISSHQIMSADRSLLVLPLYHINAECVTLIPTLMSGGSAVIPHGFVVSDFWNWLDDYRCTWSAVVPTIISQLLDWNDPKADSRAAASSASTSCAPLPPRSHRCCTRIY